MIRQTRQLSYLRWLTVIASGLLAIASGGIEGALAQEAPLRFGGAYADLDSRRQQLVDNWVARFVATTGRKIEPQPFYDETLTLSAKTTFEAVTHALMTTQLTDGSGGNLGDALALVEEVDAIRGEIAGAAGDRQFRMYGRLEPGALAMLARSREFRRGVDNAIYHKGYPTNYRAQGGVPSIQFSIALDGRRADIDVDYRSASFPVGLFNGHLTSSNSDVRAGNNFDRHVNRWTGFQNWWNNIFGVRQNPTAEIDAEFDKSGIRLGDPPRVGKKEIDEMVRDFLSAWLIEGDVVAAMGYISERSYDCLAQDRDNPADFDRGVAPFQLMINLKSAHDSLAPRSSLEGLTVGTRYVAPALRVVRQPHHAQFVIYAVPDDVAASFDCESRLTLGDPKSVRRAYGNYFGASFYIDGGQSYPVALLWAREDGYWKIVSWKVGSGDDATSTAPAAPAPKIVRVNADPTYVQSARGFLETWLIRKDYDAAFAYLSPQSYGCYDLERGPQAPASTSPEDAGRKLRAGLEALGEALGPSRRLDAIMTAVEPSHPAIRVMNHQYARVFSLSSLPNALADAVECDARARGITISDQLPLEYGNAYGMTVRFLTRSGEAPILRLMWRRDTGDWRITSYGIELP